GEIARSRSIWETMLTTLLPPGPPAYPSWACCLAGAKNAASVVPALESSEPKQSSVKSASWRNGSLGRSRPAEGLGPLSQPAVGLCGSTKKDTSTIVRTRLKPHIY